MTPRKHLMPSRHGSSLIDIVVVAAVIAFCLPILVCVIQSSRQTQRRLECLNNLHRLGVAMQHFSSNTGGSLPGMASPITAIAKTAYVGWPVLLLPALDNAFLLRSIVKGAGQYHGASVNQLSPNTQERISIPIYTCSSDRGAIERGGGLSYVVNVGLISNLLWTSDRTCIPDVDPNPVSPIVLSTNLATAETRFHYPGMIDWARTQTPGNPTANSIGRAGGVFVRELPDSRDHVWLDDIANGDGAAHTLMLSENLQAGSWWNTSANQIGFGVCVPVGTSGTDHYAPLQLDFSSTITKELSTYSVESARESTTGIETLATTERSLINRNRDNMPGTAPRPSSNHVEGVNGLFCDGSGRFISEKIDKSIYLKLLTSDGVTYGESALHHPEF